MSIGRRTVWEREEAAPDRAAETEAVSVRAAVVESDREAVREQEEDTAADEGLGTETAWMTAADCVQRFLRSCLRKRSLFILNDCAGRELREVSVFVSS